MVRTRRTFHLTCAETTFRAVRMKTKVKDLRLWRHPLTSVRPGSQLLLSQHDDVALFVVTSFTVYPSLRDALATESPESVLGYPVGFDAACRLFREYYSVAEEVRAGAVVCFSLRPFT